MRVASIFFGGAIAFFLLALALAGYFFYFGNNSVSTDKVSVDIQGPTTVAGGDTVPLAFTITNKNPVAINNATIEVDFPDGTRSATNVLASYPRYVENLGTMQSGETITRSVKAVIFGGAGQTLTLPVSLSYKTPSSNAIFQKKTTYPLAISSTPLSVTVDALSETTSGAPLVFTLTVRSNSQVAISNVVLAATLPFGFSVTNSSVPMNNSSFLLGTIAPGATKQVTLTGTLTGQENDQRVFHFTVGTAKSSQDQNLAVTYMTQDASVTVASPFITTSLVLNGDTSGKAVLTPGTSQSASLSYTNKLPTTVTNAQITISVSGSAINYDSIRTTSGFYNSSNHTIVFSRDTDPALASLAPNASGLGSFTFQTLPAGVSSPNVVFSISASGTRVGQSNVPEEVTTSATKTVKVQTVVALAASSSHQSSPIANTGPIPPKANQPTTYSIIWNVRNPGSAVAGGTVTATLPNYVTYTDTTAGSGTFSYDSVTRTVSWNVGDLPQGGSAQGVFQVSITPSTSQRGGPVTLVNSASFSGFDRYAGMQVAASSDLVSTETKNDPGYVSTNSIVQ